MISVDLGLTSRIARIQRLTYTSNSYINPSLLPSSICTDFFSYFYHASLLLRCVFWLICVFLEKDFIGDSSHWFCIIYLSPVDYCYFQFLHEYYVNAYFKIQCVLPLIQICICFDRWLFPLLFDIYKTQLLKCQQLGSRLMLLSTRDSFDTFTASLGDS